MTMAAGTMDRSDYFAWGPSTPLSQCAYCRHLDPASPSPICAAFPGGVPAAILANHVDHRRPWIDPETGRPGDRGVALGRSVTFGPREGVTPEALGALYRRLDALRRRGA